MEDQAERFNTYAVEEEVARRQPYVNEVQLGVEQAAPVIDNEDNIDNEVYLQWLEDVKNDRFIETDDTPTLEEVIEQPVPENNFYFDQSGPDDAFRFEMKCPHGGCVHDRCSLAGCPQIHCVGDRCIMPRCNHGPKSGCALNMCRDEDCDHAKCAFDRCSECLLEPHQDRCGEEIPDADYDKVNNQGLTNPKVKCKKCHKNIEGHIKIVGAHRLIADRNMVCLSTEYPIGRYVKGGPFTEWKNRGCHFGCQICGHEWCARLDSLKGVEAKPAVGNKRATTEKKPTGCYKCSCNGVTPDEKVKRAHARATSLGGRFLSNTFLGIKALYEWKCKDDEHESFFASYESVMGKQRSWCGKASCAFGYESKYIDTKKIVEDQGGKLLSDRYDGSNKKQTIECPGGHIWMATPNSLKFAHGVGSFCPMCYCSRSEKNCRAYLHGLLSTEAHEYLFASKPCKIEDADGITHNLTFDCYDEVVKDDGSIINVALEFDGGQHRLIKGLLTKNQEELERVQTLDRLKDDWCPPNQVHLIRVSDLVRPELRYELIKNALIELGLTVREIAPEQLTYIATNYDDDIRRVNHYQIIADKCNLVIDTYAFIDRTAIRKLKLSCKVNPNHSSFVSTLNELKKGISCTECELEIVLEGYNCTLTSLAECEHLGRMRERRVELYCGTCDSEHVTTLEELENLMEQHGNACITCYNIAKDVTP